MDTKTMVMLFIAGVAFDLCIVTLVCGTSKNEYL